MTFLLKNKQWMTWKKYVYIKVTSRALSPALPSPLARGRWDGGRGANCILNWYNLTVLSWPQYVSSIQMLAVSLLRCSCRFLRDN